MRLYFGIIILVTAVANAENKATCDACHASTLKGIQTVDLGNSTFAINVEAHVHMFEREGCEHALITCKAGNMLWKGKTYFEINNKIKHPIPGRQETNAEFYCKDGEWRFYYAKDEPIVDNIKCIGFY